MQSASRLALDLWIGRSVFTSRLSRIDRLSSPDELSEGCRSTRRWVRSVRSAHPLEPIADSTGSPVPQSVRSSITSRPEVKESSTQTEGPDEPDRSSRFTFGYSISVQTGDHPFYS